MEKEKWAKYIGRKKQFDDTNEGQKRIKKKKEKKKILKTLKKLDKNL